MKEYNKLNEFGFNKQDEITWIKTVNANTGTIINGVPVQKSIDITIFELGNGKIDEMSIIGVKVITDDSECDYWAESIDDILKMCSILSL